MPDVRVPDIGDFTDVPVIEVLVEAGQEVAEEDPLVTLESDKATMDVPSPAAGVVSELKIAVGDKVSEGTLLLTLTPGGQDGGAPQSEDDRAYEEAPGKASQPAAGESPVRTAIEAEAEGAPEAPAPQPAAAPS